MDKKQYIGTLREGYQWCQMLHRDLCKVKNILQVIKYYYSETKNWGISKNIVKLMIYMH